MRADNNINGAVRHALERLRDLLAGSEARQFRNAHRPVGKAIRKCLRMLLGEQGGRRKDGHLFATHDRDKCRAQSDLGFTESHVTADQTIHRFSRGHVFDHGLNSGRLIGGFFKAKTVGKGFVVMCRILERVTLSGRAARIQIQQFGRGVTYLFGGLAARFFPLTRPQRVQRRIFGCRTRVARDHMQLRYRHIQGRLFCILEMQKFSFTFTQIHADQAAVTTDTVIEVHHGVADLELGQIAHHRVDLSGSLLSFATRASARAGIQLGFGDEGNAAEFI